MAVKHLEVFFLVLAVLVLWFWWAMIRMPLRGFRGPLPPLSAEQSALRDELRRHIETLAGEIGERNVFRTAKLNAAADYIEAAFTNASHAVSRQTFKAGGETCHNLAAEVRGATTPDEVVVIGAHYDSVMGSPGADDNASGVAALLVLAGSPALQKPVRTLRFVAFVNEEPPHFQAEGMGSLVYAKRCRERGEKVVAMLSLESLACYKTTKGSQKYPPPLSLFYPSRGDFIAFVGNVANAGLVRKCLASFRSHAAFPSEGGALPGWLPGIGWSDHWAFWQLGYPALMVTDTAPFRNPHYHTDGDTPDKLDYDRLSRVVEGMEKVVADLAG